VLSVGSACEDIFDSIAEWVAAHPREIVTILMMATRGNAAPSTDALAARLDAAGLLDHVWNPEPLAPPSAVDPTFPTLGQMRAANRTVLIATLCVPRARARAWGARWRWPRTAPSDRRGRRSTACFSSFSIRSARAERN
jgi:hypothetical protein